MAGDESFWNRSRLGWALMAVQMLGAMAMAISVEDITLEKMIHAPQSHEDLRSVFGDDEVAKFAHDGLIPGTVNLESKIQHALHGPFDLQRITALIALSSAAIATVGRFLPPSDWRRAALLSAALSSSIFSFVELSEILSGVSSQSLANELFWTGAATAGSVKTTRVAARIIRGRPL